MSSDEERPIFKVWVPDEKEAWVLMTVEPEGVGHMEDHENKITVVTDGGEKKTLLASSTHPLDLTHLQDLDDLCGMSNLHEAPLLDTLRRRLAADKIYTNTGSVLISLNPYKKIPGLYDSPLRFLVPGHDTDALGRMPPHVYKIANGAHVALSLSSVIKNQSVVVSGESGAGKTEASKHVMNFLIAVNQNNLLNANKNVKSGSVDTGEHIKRVLVDSNAVLEVFGNSKTVRNDNSSRFGKYIRLQYTSGGVLVSAFTETFLLEKSRLTNRVTASSGGELNERNYHIFYGLFAGSDATLSLPELKLDVGIESFSVICSPGASPFLSDDTENFSCLCKSLRTLGISDAEMKEIWSLLACILHLGNAEMKMLETSSKMDGSYAPVSPVFTTNNLDALAESLGVTPGGFVQALTIHLVQLGRRGSVTRKVLSADEVANNVNALVKWLYSGLFNWLVRKINFVHSGHDPRAASTEQETDPAVSFIGILDIFGFEILGTNSFEQLCINFTNERLQQQFNEQVFVNEQAEYEKEGLNWSSITFQDNQNVIDLICKKPSGLLNVLEEHGFLNRKPDDKALLTSYDQMHLNKHPCYKKPRFGNECFIVNHFAGSVTYTIAGFLEKNNDTLQEDLMALMDNSTNQFLLNVMGIGNVSKPTGGCAPLGYVPPIPEHLVVRVVAGDAILEDDPAVGSVRASSLRHSSSLVSSSLSMASSGNLGKKMASAMTVSFHFRHQLDELMSTLRATQPHYIKCIKPNTTKSPNRIMSNIVMEQLRYSGILEVVRIRREGYPTRMPFQEFYSSFEILGVGRGPRTWKFPSAAECSPEEAKTASYEIAKYVFTEDPLFFQIGHSKIFLKDKGLDRMRGAVKTFYADRARIIQRKFKTRRQSRWYQELRGATIDVQKCVRCWVCYKAYIKKMKAIKTIQWMVVGKRLRRQFAQKCHAATIVRRRVHVHVLQFKYKRLKAGSVSSVKLIQRLWRGVVSRMQTRRKREAWTKSQIVISRRYRGHRELNRYKKSRLKIIRLQSLCRKRIAYRIRKNRSGAVLLIQSLARSFLARRLVSSMFKCVRLIQCLIRMMLRRSRYRKDRLKVINCQAIVRRHQALMKYVASLKRCIAIQAGVRRSLARKKYQIVRKGFVCFQSLRRMFLQRRLYRQSIKNTILSQSVVRRHLNAKHYRQTKIKVIKIQSSIRGKLSRSAYGATRVSIIYLQALIRKFLNRTHFLQDRKQIIRCQSIIRRHIQAIVYRSTLAKIIRIQTILRRVLYAMRYRRALSKIVKVQAQVRMHLCSRRFARNLRLFTSLQALARRRSCRKTYIRAREMWTKVQTCVRRRLKTISYLKMKVSCKRLKICVRRFLRNLNLRRRIMALHESCQKGDVDAIRRHLSSAFYADLYVRNKWWNYQTCLHTAAQFGQLSVIELLKPIPHEILQKDINGNTALHHAAMLPNIEVVKCLERLFLMSAASLEASETLPSETAAHDSAVDGGGADSDDDDAAAAMLHHLHLGDKIKEGWLKKVSKGRWGTRQQKRWVELHEEHLLYFKNKGDKAPRGMIPVDGATVKRHPAANNKEGPSFEIFSDQISAKKKKENASLVFITENEKELQEWLIPLKVLVGLDSAFRTTKPVTYINSGLRDAWLAETNNFGETPLHIAARFYNGSCPFIRTQSVQRPVSTSFPTATVLVTPQKDIKSKFSVLEPVPLSPFRPQVPLVRVLQLCMWLIECGCPIDAKNLDGQTALHLAVQHRNNELVSCLIKKGATVDIRDNNRSTPEYFANGSVLNELKSAISEVQAPELGSDSGRQKYSPLLNRPIQLSGYSYLSFHFMKHSLSAQFADSLNFLSCPYSFYLSVSVVNRGGQLVEAVQDIKAPMIVRDSYLWWACTWNMQTPLENFDDACCVRIELRRVPKNATDTPPPAPVPTRRGSKFGTAMVEQLPSSFVVAVAEFPLDLSTLDSAVLSVPFIQPTTDSNADHSFVQVDCMLLKRSKSTTLEKYRRKVYSSEPRMLWFDDAGNNYGTSIREEERKAVGVSDAADASKPTISISDIDSLGVKALKMHLQFLRVNTAGLLEIEDFRQALKMAMLSQQQHG